MYRKHFGMRRAPFSIAPDPRYLYLSERHQEAFAHLIYGIRASAGFVLLTGEVGAGKTTICRRLLQKLPKSFEFAYIINPKLSSAELLATICDEFRISYPKKCASIKIFTDRINEYLLQSYAKRRRSILIIDEAQNLSDDVLEQIRLLTNLETNERKLLQIILIGQPELRDRLARPELRQLAQRIVARYHLGPLSKSEVPVYVSHRLRVAGTEEHIFTPESVNSLYRLSGGVPRLINTICDRALLGAYAREKYRVDSEMLGEAAREVLGSDSRVRPWKLPFRRKTAYLAAGITAALVAVATAVILYWAKPGDTAFNSSAAVAQPGTAQPAAPATVQSKNREGAIPEPSPPSNQPGDNAATPASSVTQPVDKTEKPEEK